MINKKDIEKIIAPWLEKRELFPVEIVIKKGDEIEIYIESESRTITLDDCIDLNRYLENRLDREDNDFSLMVSSAGLDQPLKVLKQYKKFEGETVDILFKDGRKLKEVTLTGSDKDGIKIQYSVMEKVEGKKKKIEREVVEKLSFNDIKWTKYHLNIK